MYEPATPPPDGSFHVVIPCYSNMDGRDHNAVVLLVDDTFNLDLPKERLFAFEMDCKTDGDLIRKVFRGDFGLSYAILTGTKDEPIDPPDGPTELCRHLGVMKGDDGVVSLEPIDRVQLHVGKEGFFWFKWPGAEFKYGPSETYWTSEMRLKDITVEGDP